MSEHEAIQDAVMLGDMIASMSMEECRDHAWSIDVDRSPEEALTFCHAAGRHFPGQSFPLVVASLVERKRGRPAEAYNYLERGLAMNQPEACWVYMMMADLCLNLGRPDSGLPHLFKAMSAFPREAGPRIRAAWILARMGTLTKARTLLDEVAEMPGVSSDERLLLAYALSECGMYWRAMVTLDTLSQEAAGNQEFLDRIESARGAVAELIRECELEGVDFAGPHPDHLAVGRTEPRPDWWWIGENIIELCQELGVSRIVVWGLRKPSDHTHHWIHRGLYRTALMLHKVWGAPFSVEWRDCFHPLDEPMGAHCLFITACDHYGRFGYSDEGMPLVHQAYYLVHQAGTERANRYNSLVQAGRCVFFDCFRGQSAVGDHGLDEQSSYVKACRASGNMRPFEYTQVGPAQLYSETARRIIFPWATDLLPWEIMAMACGLRVLVENRQSGQNAAFVGSVWPLNYEEIVSTIVALGRRDIGFYQRGTFVDANRLATDERIRQYAHLINIDKRPASMQENIALVQQGRVAPAVQGAHHLGNYLACRVLKNISYGALGITNNALASGVLGDSVLYDPDIDTLVEKALTCPVRDARDRINTGMRVIAADHTYLNRLRDALHLLRQVAS